MNSLQLTWEVAKEAHVRTDTCEAIARSRLIFKNKYLKKESVSVELFFSCAINDAHRPSRGKRNKSMWRTAPSSEVVSDSQQTCWTWWTSDIRGTRTDKLWLKLSDKKTSIKTQDFRKQYIPDLFFYFTFVAPF